MPDQVVPAVAEWSRSRFWLCHFLQQRHLRQRIDFSAPAPPTGGEADKWRYLTAFLRRARGVESRRGPAIVRHAARRCQGDPAYVQTLRLLLKEQQYHHQLFDRLAAGTAADEAQCEDAAATPSRFGSLARPMLGMRFELSVLFIDDLLLTHMLDATLPSLTGAARDVFQQVRRDRRAHLQFFAERLTREYAAFNAVRRNLRRARLRGMFRVMLALRLREDAHLLRKVDTPPTEFAQRSRTSFNRWLERIVPYRREALVRMLMAQVERPYDQPEG